MQTQVTTTSPAKLTLIKLIEQTNLSDDDLYFLSVIMTGFFAVPPAALFQRLRSEHEPTAPDSPQHQPNEAMAFFEKSKREAHEQMLAFEQTLLPKDSHHD